MTIAPKAQPGSVQRSVSRRILLFQLDGKVPNIACMRIAAHHRQLGDEVTFRWTGSPERELWDQPDAVYGSAIFEKTRPAAAKLRATIYGVSNARLDAEGYYQTFS